MSRADDGWTGSQAGPTYQQYRPPTMAPWKPPVLLAILAMLVTGIILVSRAMGDRGGTAQSLVVGAMVVGALVLAILVLAAGAVSRPVLRTGLVMLAVVLVSIMPLGAVATTQAYVHFVVRPICENLVTDGSPATTFDRVSRTADGSDTISRFFTRRLQCHYRTADAAVPEGIPTVVSLSDDRLAGSSGRLHLVGYNVASVLGFVVVFAISFPVWGWWFHTMMREARRDRAEGRPGAGPAPVETGT